MGKERKRMRLTEIRRIYCILQVPLQPLQDHKDSSTYETFEKDTTKYTSQPYQAAIRAALLEMQPQERRQDVMIMVLGWAGGAL